MADGVKDPERRRVSTEPRACRVGCETVRIENIEAQDSPIEKENLDPKKFLEQAWELIQSARQQVLRPAPYNPKRLNELTWEASLWLPPEIVKALGARLTQAANAPNLKDVLIQVRKQLRGPADNVTAEDIVHLQPPPTP